MFRIQLGPLQVYYSTSLTLQPPTGFKFNFKMLCFTLSLDFLHMRDVVFLQTRFYGSSIYRDAS